MTAPTDAGMVERDATSEFWVTCKPCAHTWIAAYLPMEMGKIGKLLKGIACPKCGESGKQIFMATEADIASLRTRSPA